MSICGKDGGIAPSAPGPLSSQMLSFSVDISATSFEPAPTSFIKFIEKSAQRLQQVESTTKKATIKQLPQCININFLINPLTREQMIEII